MFFINISGSIISPPAGVDVTTEEGLKAGMHLFETKHFIFPFLAHALGTFAGAIITSLIAINKKLILSLAIGGLFLIGGISMVIMLPAPTWFNITDLLLAYVPFAYLGYKLAVIIKKEKRI